MNKKAVGYTIFFTLLTGIFLVFVFAGTDNRKSKSAVISHVNPFSFINQDGKQFTEKDMQGKVCVVEYFFTACTGICPKLNNNMHAIYMEFKNDPSFMILSHTCNPEMDSAAILKRYADSLKVDRSKWIFLTGRKDSLYFAARNSYLLDDQNNSLQSIEDQFIHTQFFALVDKHGQVRGQIYDGLDQKELQQLSRDIRTLLKE